MKLAWGAKVSPEFCSRVLGMSSRLGVDPNWLMAIMAFETGRTFNPACRNPQSNAIGLIQFMPSTAAAMGLTTAELARMTAEDQLGQVEIYMRPYAGKFDSLADTYMAVLWPEAITKNDDYVLFSGGSAYTQNKGLDLNNDHNVSKKEAAALVEKAFEEGFKEGNYREIDLAQPAAPIEERSTVYNPEQESPMVAPAAIALLSAFGPILQGLIPQIAPLFDPAKKVAERNLGIAQVVIDTIVKASGKVNLPEAIGAMTDPVTGPEVTKKVQEAVVTQPEIMQVLEIGGGIVKARDFGVAVQNAEKPFWYNPTFWVTILFFPMMYMITYQVLFTQAGPPMIGTGVEGSPLVRTPWYAQIGFDSNTRTGLINLIVGFVFGGVCGVWLGTTVAKRLADRRAND